MQRHGQQQSPHLPLGQHSGQFGCPLTAQKGDIQRQGLLHHGFIEKHQRTFSARAILAGHMTIIGQITCDRPLPVQRPSRWGDATDESDIADDPVQASFTRHWITRHDHQPADISQKGSWAGAMNLQPFTVSINSIGPSRSHHILSGMPALLMRSARIQPNRLIARGIFRPELTTIADYAAQVPDLMGIFSGTINCYISNASCMIICVERQSCWIKNRNWLFIMKVLNSIHKKL